MGKRFLPDSTGVPERPHGVMAVDEQRYREAGRGLEPALPHLGRPTGITGLRETDQVCVCGVEWSRVDYFYLPPPYTCVRLTRFVWSGVE